MNIFKFKPSLRQCPHTMTAQSVGGIEVGFYHCHLPVNHNGLHKSMEGVVWDNSTDQLMRNAEKRSR